MSALRVTSSPPESGGEPDRAGWSALGFAACYQRDARTRRNETLSVCLFKGSVLRRKGRKKSQKFFVLRTLQSHTDHTDLTDFFYCPAEIKEIKEIFRFALCAQPVPEALSFISFISAGLEILCARCQSEFRLTCFLPCWLTSSQAQRYVSSLFGYNFHKSAKIYTRFGILFQINAYLCLRPNTVIYATMEIMDDGRHPRLRHKSIHRLL